MRWRCYPPVNVRMPLAGSRVASHQFLHSYDPSAHVVDDPIGFLRGDTAVLGLFDRDDLAADAVVEFAPRVRAGRVGDEPGVAPGGRRRRA